MQSPRETLLCHYRYDALDRLIANELPSTPGRQRFYCKSRLATEIQGANQYSMFQHGDHLLAQQQKEDDVLDATLLATDQQRSVLHALKRNQPRQSIAYSPYGHRPAENGLLSLLGFNGERPDPVTGHYLLGNGYRAFNPVLMRFNSPDSLSPFGKGGGECLCILSRRSDQSARSKRTCRASKRLIQCIHTLE
jgi:RHS repeat-associated protein